MDCFKGDDFPVNSVIAGSFTGKSFKGTGTAYVKNTICMKQTPYQFNKIVLTDSYCNVHVPVLQMIIQFVWGKNPKFITWLLIYPRLTNYYYSKNTLFMNYSNEVIKINICTWTIIHTDVKNMTTGALRYSCCSVWWEWEFPSIAVWRLANPWSPGWSDDRRSSSPVCKPQISYN